MDLKNLKISQHALERFIERHRKLGSVPNDPEACIMKLMEQAEPEDVKHFHKIRRIISNGFQPVEYYVACGWRFVVVEGTVVTIERTKRHQN